MLYTFIHLKQITKSQNLFMNQSQKFLMSQKFLIEVVDEPDPEPPVLVEPDIIDEPDSEVDKTELEPEVKKISY